MPTLLVVGGGLFGSQAAAYARRRGIEALVFDAGLEGAASPSAAGLFREEWLGRKLGEHYRPALTVLEELYGVRSIQLINEVGATEHFLCVPPTLILEPVPMRTPVTAIGDGWVEAGGQRHQGWVYVAAGIWCRRFFPELGVYGKAGSSFLFAGERAGRIQHLGHGRQAVAFVRDAGTTFFSDGTAEREYSPAMDQQTLARAAALGLSAAPIHHHHGQRPYVPGGPVFRKIGQRTWLATGGRKLGTLLGAAFAHRLIDEL